MKRVLGLLMAAMVFLGGCGGGGEEMDRALALRQKLQGAALTFDVTLTADYGDTLECFSLACEAAPEGSLTFSLTAPQALEGISGSIGADGKNLTFDGTALAVPLLAEGRLAPAAAPWVLIQSLRAGCLTSCAQAGQGLLVSVDDSYEDDALHLDIWLDGEDLPMRGEILWKGRRILTMEIQNLRIL